MNIDNSKIQKVEVLSAGTRRQWIRGEPKGKFKKIYETAWRYAYGPPPALTGVCINVTRNDGTSEQIQAGAFDDISVYDAFNLLAGQLNAEESFGSRA